MEPHGIQWNVLESHGISWDLMVPHEIPWNLMHEISWDPKKPCRTSQNLMKG
jgi:hypothetical protein